MFSPFCRTLKCGSLSQKLLEHLCHSVVRSPGDQPCRTSPTATTRLLPSVSLSHDPWLQRRPLLRWWHHFGKGTSPTQDFSGSDADAAHTPLTSPSKSLAGASLPWSMPPEDKEPSDGEGMGCHLAL